MESNAPAQLDIPLPALPGIEKGWELLLLEQNKQSGLFTAERIAQDEQRLNTAIRALAEGMSIRAIAASLSCSTNTILAVKRRFGPDIETVKQEIGRDCLDVARMAVERIRDEIDEMPRASLPIIAGVMVDKGQLLTGAPTTRVQHDHHHTVGDVADYINSLPNVTPVGEGESAGQKAGGAIELPGADVVLAGAVDERLSSDAGDSQSFVSAQVTQQAGSNGADNGQIGAQKGGQS